jgi:hypothetical protein
MLIGNLDAMLVNWLIVAENVIEEVEPRVSVQLRVIFAEPGEFVPDRIVMNRLDPLPESTT